MGLGAAGAPYQGPQDWPSFCQGQLTLAVQPSSTVPTCKNPIFNLKIYKLKLRPGSIILRRRSQSPGETDAVPISQGLTLGAQIDGPGRPEREAEDRCGCTPREPRRARRVPREVFKGLGAWDWERTLHRGSRCVCVCYVLPLESLLSCANTAVTI